MLSDGRNDFQDFLTQYVKYQKFAQNPVAQGIFDLLNSYNSIQKMILASQAKRAIPALAACINDIESTFISQINLFDFVNDDSAKQAVGSMVRVILNPFGYEKERKIGNNYDSKGRISSHSITSAKIYSKNITPRINLVSTLSILPATSTLLQNQEII